MSYTHDSTFIYITCITDSVPALGADLFSATKSQAVSSPSALLDQHKRRIWCFGPHPDSKVTKLYIDISVY